MKSLLDLKIQISGYLNCLMRRIGGSPTLITTLAMLVLFSTLMTSDVIRLTEVNPSLAPCPKKSPLLEGTAVINLKSVHKIPESSREFKERFGNLESGGKYRPPDCISEQKVAIIVPFRDREFHLYAFTFFIHPILQRQQIQYQLFIIEQSGNGTADFSRGNLMNVGFVEALKKDPGFDCFVFHDVDLIPENDRILYNCMKDKAKHLSVAIQSYDKEHNYKLLYPENFGGATALTKQQFQDANGFSDKFYGWGGEDDDLYNRVVKKLKIPIYRYPGNVARYTMLKHRKAKGNEERVKLIRRDSIHKQKEDGLSSLKYKKLEEKLTPLYTKITVELPTPPEHIKDFTDYLKSGANFLMKYIK